MRSRVFEKKIGTDPAYNACRQHSTKQLVRKRIERMWRAYEPYCPDRHFLSDISANFNARTWELYIASVFLRRRFRLTKPPSKGPDLLATVGDQRLWIEAVAPSSGEGPDKVPDREERGSQDGNLWEGHPPSEDSLILRCTTSLEAKLKRIADYKRDGIIGNEDVVLVALTLGGIEDADVASPDFPIAVKAVFGIGEAYLALSWEDGSTENGFMRRPEVQKNRGTTVDARLFCAKRSRAISGLLYTATNIFNAPRVAGRDLVLVHNPYAAVPLRRGMLRFVRAEYWVGSDGRLMHHDNASA